MPRKQNLPIESSWRVVEGENDSFDTSILRDTDDELVLSSGNPSQLSPSQLSGSQPFSVAGSQDDNLQTFLSKAEQDEQVIMRSPFRPSVPQSVRQSSRDNRKHQSPEPEFRFPSVDVESPRRRPAASTRTSSSRTARPGDDSSAPGLLRRRQFADTGGGSPSKKTSRRQQYYADEGGPRGGLGGRLAETVPDALFTALAWLLGVVGLAFRYAQKPLAVFLAVYFTFGALIVAQNMATRSLSSALSPLCRLPGASWLDLPFCPAFAPPGDGSSPPRENQPVEFDGLMGVQERFEQVLEKAARGVSLPMEMKRSEASVRDLRTAVRYSTLQARDELVLEFDGFIDAARAASNDLQRFNTHVGSAVDSVISINRWTSRHIDSLAAPDRHLPGGWLDRLAAWAFAPFRPAPTTFSERALLDQYVAHTALVSERIGDLIVEAQAVLGTLARAEDHLGLIRDLVARTRRDVATRRDEVLWTLWTLVGANARRLGGLAAQLALLRQVDGQRAGAAEQVADLVAELERIQAGLADLRDRVAAPAVVRAHGFEVPLSVHVETIDKGVERLEEARRRIRAVENERIREVLARGKDGEILIESS